MISFSRLTRLTPGSLAPDFQGVDQDGATLTLESLLSGGRLVLYFYPRDFTRVCTAEACLFRDATRELAQLNASIAGVSTDSSDSHSRFAAQHGVKFRLIADPERRITRAYDADRWLGFTKRVTYVIDRDKKILGAFQHELSAQKHLEDVRRILLG
ncbi:MAG: peroxiredoxin [Polyangiaceae bacterium]